MYKSLSYFFKEPIATITLNRPEASNCIDLTMVEEIRQAVQQILEEKTALVAIITGVGDVFSSGRARLSSGVPAEVEYGADQWLRLHRVASTIAGLPTPVIAVLNGDAVDHGLELALACDLRIAARGAKMGFSDLSNGTLPWDGGTQRLPRLVGRGQALEMLLTSRLVDTDEALHMGLVNMVVEPEVLISSAEKVASEIASGGPVAARYAKEAVLKGMDMTIDQGLTLEADLNLLLFSTRDRDEGLSSFKEKRKPKFKGE